MEKYLLSGLLALASLATFAQNTQSSISFPSLNKVKIVDADGSSQVLSATATTYRYVSWSRRLIIKEFGQVVFEAHINTVDVDTARSVLGKITLLDLKLAIPSTSSGVGKSLSDGAANFAFDGTRWNSNASIVASGFNGPGGGITNLSAGNLLTGTVAAARLPGNLAYRDAGDQTWTGTNRLNGLTRFTPNQTAFGGTYTAVAINPVINASANGDALTALEISPNFQTGSFTGTTNRALRVVGVTEVTQSLVMGGSIFMPTAAFIYANQFRSSNTSNDMTFANNSGSQWLRIYQATGNTQIGGSTIDDGNKLQVAGSASFAGDLVFDGNGIRDIGSVTGRTKKIWSSDADVSNLYGNRVFINFIRSRNSNLAFENNLSARTMTVFESSNVNIGSSTTDPGVRLNVEGTVQATGLSVSGPISFNGQLNASTIVSNSNAGITGYIRTGGGVFAGVTDISTVPNSVLAEFRSSSQGVLFPRMTSAQRTGISSPATGLIVYQTDGAEGIYVKTSTAWKMLTMN